MAAHAHGSVAEAERQRLLLQAITTRSDAPAALVTLCSGPAAAVDAGVRIYRGNLHAAVERALAGAYPTLAQLIGAEAFAALARHCCALHTPQCGDLAQYGAELPDIVAASAGLANEPYLADVARLEWAVHRATLAADAPDDVTGLERLADTDPAQLLLRMAPGGALMASTHPIVAIWRAHRGAEADAVDPDERYREVRQAFAEQRAETAFIWRRGLHVDVAALPQADARCMATLLQGASLDAALTAATSSDGSADFDFETWLLRALRERWLASVHPIDAAAPAHESL